jgi:hypothetical protein
MEFEVLQLSDCDDSGEYFAASLRKGPFMKV